MSEADIVRRIMAADAGTLARVARALDGGGDGGAADTAQLLTIEEARARLSVSRTTVWHLEKRGALKPVVLPCGGKRYTLANVRALMRGKTEGGAA